jgi:hypothetical protein
VQAVGAIDRTACGHHATAGAVQRESWLSWGMASVPDGEEAAPPVSRRGGGEAVRAGAGPREERGSGGRARGHGACARALS